MIIALVEEVQILSAKSLVNRQVSGVVGGALHKKKVFSPLPRETRVKSAMYSLLLLFATLPQLVPFCQSTDEAEDGIEPCAIIT